MAILNGYKTYAGLIMSLVGLIGLTDIFTQIEVEKFLELGVTLVGIAMAWYGRWHAQKRLTK